MDLQIAKENMESLCKEAEEEERRTEHLRKLFVQSEKKLAEKKKQIGVAKKRVLELDADCNSAAKRLHLLSFEYFDVTNKEWTEKQKGGSKKSKIVFYFKKQ